MFLLITFNIPLKALLVVSMLIFTIANGLLAIVTSFKWLSVTRVMAALAVALFTPLA